MVFTVCWEFLHHEQTVLNLSLLYCGRFRVVPDLWERDRWLHTVCKLGKKVTFFLIRPRPSIFSSTDFGGLLEAPLTQDLVVRSNCVPVLEVWVRRDPLRLYEQKVVSSDRTVDPSVASFRSRQRPSLELFHVGFGRGPQVDLVYVDTSRATWGLGPERCFGLSSLFSSLSLTQGQTI